MDVFVRQTRSRKLVAQARAAGADSIDSALPLRSRPQSEAFVRAIREAP